MQHQKRSVFFEEHVVGFPVAEYLPFINGLRTFMDGYAMLDPVSRMPSLWGFATAFALKQILPKFLHLVCSIRFIVDKTINILASNGVKWFIPSSQPACDTFR